MLKKKIKIISLIALLLISLFAPIVNAENETNENQAVPINETQETITIEEGDKYLFQESVTIDNPVDGNLFIMANTVTINSQVGGDAFIVANTINIEENGYVLSNLFACANTIHVKGVAYNIYSVGDTLTIDGFVYRDVKSICNTLNINSMIGRDVFTNCSSINFKEKPNTEGTPSITSYGSIQGDLNYSSDKEISIPDGHVSGETHFSQLQNHTTFDISNYIYSLGAILVSAIIIWLIGLWISPKLLHNASHPITVRKALQIIGLGIIVPIVITLLSFIILLIPITSHLMILLLCILAILFFISTSVAIININTMICNKLKITQNVYKLGFLIVTTVVFWLLTLIPYVGMVISFIAMVWGIGIVSYNILVKENSNEKKSDSSKKISNSEKKKEKVEPKTETENTSGTTTNIKEEIKSDKSTDPIEKDKPNDTTNSKEENKSSETEKNENQNKETDKNDD